MAVSLSDISVKGCRIASDGLDLSVNQYVILRPDGLEHLTGTVRWVSSHFAGIEFDLPLHPSVVDYLCKLHPEQGRLVAMEIAA